MVDNFKKIYKNKKGFTLVELVIVVPSITIIFILAYSMLFLTQKSFNNVNASFDMAEEIRIFQINIQKEANQAKKAEETKDVINRVSQGELHIYTDIDNDEIPEIVRYRLDNKKLIRDVKYKKTAITEYPYAYNGSFKNEKVVVNNVINTDIFGEVEKVREAKEGEGADYRRKVKMKLKIQNNSNIVEINTYLITKSRAEAE